MEGARVFPRTSLCTGRSAGPVGRPVAARFQVPYKVRRNGATQGDFVLCCRSQLCAFRSRTEQCPSPNPLSLAKILPSFSSSSVVQLSSLISPLPSSRPTASPPAYKTALANFTINILISKSNEDFPLFLDPSAATNTTDHFLKMLPFILLLIFL